MHRSPTRYRPHRRQRDPLPNEGQQGQWHQAEERTTPADDTAQIAAQRRSNDGSQRIASIENRQRFRNAVRRYQPHRHRRRHGPESAHHHANQRAAHQIDGVAGCHANHQAGDAHQRGQAQQQRLAVGRSGQRRHRQAGQHRERAGNGDAVADPALAHAHIACHRRQQAHRHELGRNQHKDAERHCPHAAPMGRGLSHGRHADGIVCRSTGGWRVHGSSKNRKRRRQACRHSECAVRWTLGAGGTYAARCWLKNAVSLVQGIRFVRSYRSTWLAPGTQWSSLGSAARS